VGFHDGPSGGFVGADGDGDADELPQERQALGGAQVGVHQDRPPGPGAALAVVGVGREQVDVRGGTGEGVHELQERPPVRLVGDRERPQRLVDPFGDVGHDRASHAAS
jgi:hypothetical protein